MASRLVSRIPHISNQENPNEENSFARLKNKTVAGSKEQCVKRGALGDLGNKIHTIQNGTKISGNSSLGPGTKIHTIQNGSKVAGNSSMGPPVAFAKKKIEVTKKIVPAASKENVTKAKENLVKVAARRPIRQESIIQNYQKLSNQSNSKPVESEKTIVKQANELVIYDPDEDTKNDPLMLTEYIQDILAYLRKMEEEYPIREKFLEDAKVTPKMRAMLINWLAEVHQNFSMDISTLHLCVSIVDRYLQVNKSVDRSIFQLVGTAALLLAAKYEEVYIPDIEDFVYVCDGAFTKKQLFQMEIEIFSKLDFKMGWPSSIYFLRRCNKVARARQDHHNLAKYILELALLEYPLAHLRPSIQAAAACCLAIATINEVMDPAKVWTPTLVHYTKIKYSDFKDVVYDFARMIVGAETSKFDTIRNKYATAKWGKVSLNFKLKGPLLRKLSSMSKIGNK